LTRSRFTCTQPSPNTRHYLLILLIYLLTYAAMYIRDLYFVHVF